MEEEKTYKPLNAKLIAKREETEKLIEKEYLRVKAVFTAKKNSYNKLTSLVENLQEKSISLTNRSALLSSEINQLKISTAQDRILVQDILCNIDETIPQKKLANMVLEKEQKTLEIYYDQMKEQKRIQDEFQENLKNDADIFQLGQEKQKMIVRQEALKDQIIFFKEKCSKSKITKITEECMVLRKRNAALVTRKKRVLEQLQKKMFQKKEEISRAKRNMTFKSS